MTEHMRLYSAICRECLGESFEVALSPTSHTAAEREDWIAMHKADTGHDNYKRIPEDNSD